MIWVRVDRIHSPSSRRNTASTRWTIGHTLQTILAHFSIARAEEKMAQTILPNTNDNCSPALAFHSFEMFRGPRRKGAPAATRIFYLRKFFAEPGVFSAGYRFHLNTIFRQQHWYIDQQASPPTMIWSPRLLHFCEAQRMFE